MNRIQGAMVPFVPFCIRKMLPDVTSPPTSYTEITRRLPKGELLAVEEKMQRISFCDHERFIELIQQGDLPAILQIKDSALHALYAVKSGTISPEEFATITFVYASSDPNKTCIALFDVQGQVNPEAKDLIGQTLFLQGGVGFSKKLLTADELSSFFAEMAKLPPLQRYFFLEKTRRESPIRAEIETQYGLNIFSKCTYQEKLHHMIPSAGMMQTLLNVKFKENAVRMNFVLGLSSIEDIRQSGWEGTRDAALPFPGTTIPTEADTFSALGIDFTYHDFFHALVVSCATLESRKEMLLLAESIRKVIHPRFYNSLIDLEMGAHYKINIRLKEPRPEYVKFFMEVDTKIAYGSIFDPSLEIPSYQDRLIYEIAKLMQGRLHELQEYSQWGKEFLGKEIIKHKDRSFQLLDKMLDTTQEISALKAEGDHSERIVLEAVREGLKEQYRDLNEHVTSLGLHYRELNRAPIHQIIHVLQRPDTSFSTRTIVGPDIKGKAYGKIPHEVIIGLVMVVVLRVLFRSFFKKENLACSPSLAHKE